ncbi:aminoglycoside phosphotransferase family protein [Micromonospora sp. RTP1Z1]|uniref:aminoglycoside phosphotransferase family protein n=1 Tax=Micromonospora sp. RTP1Z1 TaxID=2994043 RepID=UPI0029C88AFE|nr:aminoglycoside phosphotransferase family protein [Micromonospora sp. RTP1Z1]
MIEDGNTASGSVTTVRRVGDTIRRPRGRWTPTVHALLNHLADVGFTGAPRVLGIDSEGREVLSLLHGEPAIRPWPESLRERRGIEQLAGWLANYHDAVANFVPPSDAVWFDPEACWRPGSIIRHGDLGPWNSIWSGGQLVGFIDWDFAEPGEAIDDLAQLAWYAVPLRDLTGPAEWAHAAKRLEWCCAAYGARPGDVLAALLRLQHREADRVRRLGGQGIEPWASFLARGDAEDIEAEWRVLQSDGRLLTDGWDGVAC